MELVRSSDGADLMQRSVGGVITAQPRGTGALTGEEPTATVPTAPELEENEDDR